MPAGSERAAHEAVGWASKPVRNRGVSGAFQNCSRGSGRLGHTARLKVLQKVLSKKGDKEGAAAVEAELEKMGTAIAQQMRYPIEGKWVVKYQNGAIRTYRIHANGAVKFEEANLAGRFTKNGDDVLVDFGDDKLERFYWNTVLVVEHYNPKSTYGKEAAQTTGFAEKAP